MNYDAINAHMRLMESGDLPRRTHENVARTLPQGRRMPSEMRATVRELLRTKTVSDVARETGIHPKTVAKIRDAMARTTST